MAEFIQLHIVTVYPPSNVNRDDLGRPKTAHVGGVPRLRISSQCLKRTWRTSDVFQEALAGNIGTRTKLLGVEAFDALVEKHVGEKQAKEWAQSIAGIFGKLKTETGSELEIEQLVHVSPQERAAIDVLVEKLGAGKRGPTDDELNLLKHDIQAADIAMFGRMLAASPEYNVDAAVQVSHAFTVNRTADEDDYFTAVDDLNEGKEDAGSAHIGEAGFGAGVFYLYVCINKDLLLENLGGNADICARALRAMTQSALTVAPSGKQNSFASRVRASYALAERGTQQPRSLAAAFLKPIDHEDQLGAAIGALDSQRINMDAVYGACSDKQCILNVVDGSGTLDDLLGFVAA